MAHNFQVKLLRYVLRKIEFHLVYPHLEKQILRKRVGNILNGYHSSSHAYRLILEKRNYEESCLRESYSELYTALPNAIN